MLVYNGNHTSILWNTAYSKTYVRENFHFLSRNRIYICSTTFVVAFSILILLIDKAIIHRNRFKVESKSIKVVPHGTFTIYSNAVTCFPIDCLNREYSVLCCSSSYHI